MTERPPISDGLGDIRSTRLLVAKGVLFVVLGLIAGGTLIALHSSLTVVVLLLIAVWAFCRAYYLAFYVIEHYVDPGYRFDGVFSAIRFLWRRRRDRP
ncbi:MAG: hypothetical protein AAGI54_15160 [Planctomycetota bacterium]